MAFLYIMIGILLTLGIEFVAILGLAIYFNLKYKFHK